MRRPSHLWPRFRQLVHGAIVETGLDVVPTRSIRHALGRRARLIRELGVDFVIDVGANTGQFGAEIRDAGYSGPILSVEPLSTAFAELEERAVRDGNWIAIRCALGDREGRSTLNIAGNSASSSLLDMLSAHEDASPETRYVGVEQVAVRRLDAVLAEQHIAAARPYLKIDVQGYELAVLRGVSPRLRELAIIQVELSLARLYAAGPLYREVDDFVTDAGFALVGVEPGFAHRASGRLLQVDGIYARADLLSDLERGASKVSGPEDWQR